MKQQQESPTGEALCERAYRLFEEYRDAYAGEWQRLEKAERMYRGDHWYDVPMTDPNEPRPVTPIIQSTIENVSADLMDMLPQAVITPETPADEEIAKVVEAIIRQSHDAVSYEREYMKLVHDLLVGGYMIQEVGYDPLQNGGLGGSYIRYVDNRSIMFDPLCTEIQDGRGILKFSAKTKEWLRQHYPKQAVEMQGDGYQMSDIANDEVLSADRHDMVLLIEYWWREYDSRIGRHKVHMALVAGGKLLSDSRDVKPEGYFAHGLYPFHLTRLFPRKGSALGLGFVDMFEAQQKFSDKLDQIVLKNALMASHNKLLVTEASGFDVEDLRDWSKEVHKGESLNGVTWFSTPPLPSYIMQYIQLIRESIKEESGANDFSRGGATGGITAASAIAALQEMSSKRARMASRQIHQSFKDAVRMQIEVEREFNIFERQVLITENGEQKAVRFSTAMLEREGRFCGRLPIEFYISIKVQHEPRWSALSQNELVVQMIQMGILEPAQAVELMHFDGKDQVVLAAAKRQQQQQTAVRETPIMPTTPKKQEKRKSMMSALKDRVGRIGR